MSLTMGSIAPLGRPTGGVLNVAVPARPAHLLYLHDLDRRIRGDAAGVTVVDTHAARMLHETALPPRWYFPRPSVTAVLEPSGTTSHCPFKGDARYWDLRVGDRLIRDAFWEYPEPLPGAPSLAGLLSPYTEKFDGWREEDEPVPGPIDPFHRVDCRRSQAHVVVRVGGEVVADTRRPVALYETGLPTRWYIPAEDTRGERLEPSATVTTCPYKGEASYWSVRAGDRRFDDVVWSYDQPRADAAPVGGYRSFLGEGVAVEVDPVTPASPPAG